MKTMRKRKATMLLLLVWSVLIVASCRRQQGIAPSLQLSVTVTPVSAMLPAAALSSPMAVGSIPPLAPATILPVDEASTSERLCSDGDFDSTAGSPDMNTPETLVGFRPLRDWPSESGWEFVYSLLLWGTNYGLSGYRHDDQHLVLLKKRLCRYGEGGRYALFEIVGYVLLSDLRDDEVVIIYPDIVLFQSDAVAERLEYQIEAFFEVECDGVPGHAIVRGNYDAVGLPDRIEPRYRLPIGISSGWYPDPEAGEFRSVPADGVSCKVLVQGT